MKKQKSISKTFKTAALVLGAGLCLNLSGCSKAEAADRQELLALEQQVQTLEQRLEQLSENAVTTENFSATVAKLEKQTAQLKAANDQLAGENLLLKRNAKRAEAKRVAAEKEAAEKASRLTAVEYTDIEDKYGSAEIQLMASLGLFGQAQGEFHPNAPITRAEFVRWLVKANNIYSGAGLGKRQLIRLAEHQQSTFTDVPADHPDFRYIQGMVDAGFVIGYDETTFAPDRPLSREELVAIKGAVDYNGNQTADRLQTIQAGWSDSNQISKKYYGAFYWDRYTSSPNIPRTFGSFKAFRPQQPTSRAEAAICLTAITNHSNSSGPGPAYASEALKVLQQR